MKMSSEDDFSDEDGSFEDDGEEDAEIASEDDEEPTGVRHFTAGVTAKNKDSESGEAVRVQLAIWDGLLETRIKLQKPLSSCNTLPRAVDFSDFESAAPDSSSTLDETRESLRTLLEDLAGLQDVISKNNPALSAKSAADDEEEINSDSEAEEKDADEVSHPNPFADRSLSLTDMEDLLEKRYRKLEPFRNATLEKWNSKTHQFAVGLKKNFSAFDQSPVKQITQIMSDTPRLIQRTQTPRTSYRVLGTNDSDEASAEHVHQTAAGKTVQVNPEVFDDDDFYHVLLRELIERKTGDVSDPIELSRQQIQLSQLRKHTKKVVDSKATRDRKLKFDPHPKLISFMALQQSCTITEQARNDIYKSLFGKLQRRNDLPDDVTSGLGDIRLLK